MKNRLKQILVVRFHAVILLLLALAIGQSVNAANELWTGSTSANWSAGGNWTSGNAPARNDFLYFGLSGQTSPNNDISGLIVGGMLFTNTGSFTLTGNALILTNWSEDVNANFFGGSISNSSTGNQTINLPLTLSAGNHYIVTTSSGKLNIANTVTRKTGAVVIFTNLSTGYINVNGSGLTTANGILGGWALMGSATGITNAGSFPQTIVGWATLDGSGGVTNLGAGLYSQVSTATAGGIIPNGSGNNVKVITNNAYLAAGTTTINTLMWGPTNAANGTITLGTGTNLNLGATGAILTLEGSAPARNVTLSVGTTAGSGSVTAGASGTGGEILLLNDSFFGANNDLTVNANIIDNGSGPVALTTDGYVVLAGTGNNYSGGTYVNQGRLQMTGANCLGFGSVYVFPGGELFNGTVTNTVYITGFGPNESGHNGFGAFRSVTASGPVILMDNAAVGAGTLSGVVSGSASLIIGAGNSGSGVGTTTVGSANGANTYTGDTVIGGPTNATYRLGGACTLKIASGVNNIMPNGAGFGNVILNAPITGGPTNCIFDLNGTAQTINGLIATANLPNNDFVQSLTAGGVLTVGADNGNSIFAGILQNGGGTLALTKTGSGTFTLTGANTYTGNTTVSAGELDTTTASTGAGNYTVADNATLNVKVTATGQSLNVNALTLGSSSGSTLEIDTAALGNPTAPVVNAASLVVNGTTTIHLYGTALATGTFTILTNTPGNRTGSGTIVLNASPRLNATLNDDTANNRVTITLGTPDSGIVWRGGVSGNWDINNGGNNIWVGNNSGTPTDYTEDPVFGDDVVRFDDTATGTTTVNLTTTVSPQSLTVSNTTAGVANYAFAGSGKISGTIALVKQGSGALALTESGGDNFSGGITVSGGTVVVDNDSSTVTGGTTISSSGTVQLGNNDANGALPSGSVALGGALNLNRTNSYTLANVISGSGTLSVNPGNSNAVITVSGANAGYAGAITVASGTLQVNNNAALGGTPGGVTNSTIVANGATLDLGGSSFAANGANLTNIWIYTIGWGANSNGAIVQSSALSQQNAVRHVVLTGDTAIGGPGNFTASGNPGRFDIRGTGASLSTGGNAYNLYKIGGNQATLVSATVDSALANIDVQQGELGVEQSSGLGNPAGKFIIRAGATVELFNTYVSLTSFALNKQFIFYGDGVDTNVIANNGGMYGTWSNTFVGPVILTNGDVVMAGGKNPSGMLFSNVVSGPGGFIVGGTFSGFTNYFTTNNTYTGNTTVKIGTLALVGSGSISTTPTITVNSGAIVDVSLRNDGALTLASGQTLKGNGTVVGTTVVGSGATVSPGASVGLLTQTGSLLLQGGGTNVMEVSNPGGGPGGADYDTMAVSGNVGVLSSSGNPFTIKLVSLPATNFNNNASYSWTNASGTVTNFAATDFTVDTSAFTNDLAGGNFTMATNTGGLLVNFVVNHAPVANTATYSHSTGSLLKIAISDLLTNYTSDPDGDARALVSHDSISAGGASVTDDGTYIYYNIATNAADNFNYTVRDVRNYRVGDTVRTASGVVQITVTTSTNQTYNITASVVNGDNSLTLSGAGIPGRTNVVERTDSLSQPIIWTPVGTNVIDGTGHWQFTDPTPTDPAFYRSVTQP